eukprot:scpid65551/ scgid33961/ 
MALPLGMLGASGCKNGGMQSVFSFLEELRGCFQVVNCPKDARSEMEQAKTCVLNLNVIVHKVMDMAFKMTFQLHQAGPGGKGDRRERERLQRAIASALRDGPEQNWKSYNADLTTRWKSLRTELAKLEPTDDKSYISKTTQAIKEYHDAAKKADYSFAQRHPVLTGICGGALVGGLLGLAIAVPIAGWIGGLIGLGIGAVVCGGLGGYGMKSITPNPVQAFNSVLHLQRSVSTLIDNLNDQFDFLGCDYTEKNLLISLEEKWRDEHNYLQDAILGYPKVLKDMRELRAAF